MSDWISRQDALDMLKKTIAVNKNPNHDARVWEEGMNCAITIIGALPSAQPEIVRCKDCKNRYIDCPMYHVEWVEYDDDGYIDVDDIVYDYTEDDGFCYKGVRRTDG